MKEERKTSREKEMREQIKKKEIKEGKERGLREKEYRR